MGQMSIEKRVREKCDPIGVKSVSVIDHAINIKSLRDLEASSKRVELNQFRNSL